MVTGSSCAAAAALALNSGGGRRATAAEVPKTLQPGAPRPEDIKLPAGGKMPMRKLGRTGVEVSLLGLGGFHIGLPEDEQTASASSAPPIDHGVTFMDNCWDYNDGESEVRMGQALARRLPQERLPDDQDRRPHAHSRRPQQIDESLQRASAPTSSI